MTTVENDSIYIPIPQYPPFKLRSSLIDKDPVIWAHLLEAYLNLFKYLLEPDANRKKLAVKSQQQLQLFMKVFLFETSEESTKIFSLGAINPEIRTSTAKLRVYVFQYIKNYSIVKSNLTGESIWHFIIIYVKNNANIVRGLVDGSFKSKFNDNKKSGNISSIDPVQKHLANLISNGKFKTQDLSTLSLLLGQHTSLMNKTKTYTITNNGTSSKSNRNINKKLSNSLGFAEAFVSIGWIELLEKLYVNGKSIHAKQIEEVMTISLISLPATKIAKLTLELGINGVDVLSVYPLFSTIIISDSYQELIPGLEERLPFLRSISLKDVSQEDNVSISEAHIKVLTDLFPQLTKNQAVSVLKENNDNVENVTNILLENPDLIENIPEDKLPEKSKLTGKPPKSPDVNKRSIYDGDRFSSLDFTSDSIIPGKKSQRYKPTSDDLKKKTLTAALRLMYESDEDEPDDTYDDQEKTSGVAIGDESDKAGKKVSSRNKIVVYGEESVEPIEVENAKASSGRSIDETEQFLFSLFKSKGADQFTKGARRTKDRKKIKELTGWSDEQIEGWLRMLLKSPRRFKILEEDYFYGGNPNRPVMTQNANKSENFGETSTDTTSNENKAALSKDQTKRSHLKDDRHKASKGNHNRKKGYNKKRGQELAGMQ